MALNSYHYSDIRAKNADEMADNLPGFEQTYLQTITQPFVGRTTTIRFDDLQIARECAWGAVHEQGAAIGNSYNFVLPLSVHGHVRCMGQDLSLDRVYVLSRGFEYDLEMRRELSLGVLTIDRDSLRAFAPHDECSYIEKLGETSRILRCAPQATSHLRSLLQSTFARLDGAHHELAKPGFRRCLRASLFSALLSLLGCEREEHAVQTSVRNPVVDRAISYALAHQHAAASIEDICRELHVSRRKLQYCFQKEFDISPAQYLRALRLHSARRALQSTCASEKSIADVASDHGFWHCSRFAQDYRRMFGELPSDTRRADTA